MSNHSDSDLPRRLVGEIEDSLISYTDPPAVAVLELLASGRERIGFQRKENARDPLLRRSRKPRQFLLRIAGELDPPVHTRIRRSFSTLRRGVCG